MAQAASTVALMTRATILRSEIRAVRNTAIHVLMATTARLEG